MGKRVSNNKPLGGSNVMAFAGGDMVGPRVWRRQPTSTVLLELVPYEVARVKQRCDTRESRTLDFGYREMDTVVDLLDEV